MAWTLVAVMIALFAFAAWLAVYWQGHAESAQRQFETAEAMYRKERADHEKMARLLAEWQADNAALRLQCSSGQDALRRAEAALTTARFGACDCERLRARLGTVLDTQAELLRENGYVVERQK